MDTEKTKVIFRKFKNGGIIAYFPEIPGDNNQDTCMSYMRIGRHGVATALAYPDTKLASETEYQDLKNELERIGYNLEVIKKFSFKFMLKRKREIERK